MRLWQFDPGWRVVCIVWLGLCTDEMSRVGHFLSSRYLGSSGLKLVILSFVRRLMGDV